MVRESWGAAQVVVGTLWGCRAAVIYQLAQT